jgi:hypothetical protein
LPFPAPFSIISDHSRKQALKGIGKTPCLLRNPMTLEEIHNKIRQGMYRFSDHSVKRMIHRNVIRQEVESAILTGEIIEE